MKTIKIYLFHIAVVSLLLAAQACSTASTDAAKAETQACDTGIVTGDLLFVALPWDYSIYDNAEGVNAKMNAIADTDNVNYIHVAILETSNDSVWVIDATIKHGVDRYPLDTFLSDFTLPNGAYPLFRIMRLTDNSHASQYVEQAKQYIGRAYDVDFDTNNEAQYCSELVYNAYVNVQNDHLFKLSPISFQKEDGSYPIYWQELFALINKPVPQGKIGILPCAMIEEPFLKPVKTHILH